MREGYCESCGCTRTRSCRGGCSWTDETATHCTACFCFECGHRFEDREVWVFLYGERSCRATKACAARSAKKRRGRVLAVSAAYAGMDLREAALYAFETGESPSAVVEALSKVRR